MIYVTENGYDVCLEGSVIIESVEHYVKNKYVSCNTSLNSKAWGITKKISTCNECAKYLQKGQLKLF